MAGYIITIAHHADMVTAAFIVFPVHGRLSLVDRASRDSRTVYVGIYIPSKATLMVTLILIRKGAANCLTPERQFITGCVATMLVLGVTDLAQFKLARAMDSRSRLASHSPPVSRIGHKGDA